MAASAISVGCSRPTGTCLLNHGVLVTYPRKICNFRIADITGQSLPTFVRLFRIDVLWSDLHIVHQGRSARSYDSFCRTFRTA
jgi:hypothetical protein